MFGKKPNPENAREAKKWEEIARRHRAEAARLKARRSSDPAADRSEREYHECEAETAERNARLYRAM